MSITWATTIAVKNLTKKEVTITAIRTNSVGPVTKTYRILSVIIKTPEQRIAVREMFKKMVLESETKQTEEETVIDDLEDTLKNALETWEQER